MKAKNGLRKTLASLLVVVLLLTSAPLSGIADLDFSGVADWFSTTAKAATEGIFTYEVDYDSATITNCDNAVTGEVVIPSTLGGYPVTRIGEDAFEWCDKMTSITIPNSVTSIGSFAFSGCTGLTSITIPDSVTSIGGSAFSGCTGLTSITIPDSVTSIDWGAFANCTGLTSITIPDSVTSIVGSAFSGCTGLIQLTVSSGNKVYHSQNNCIIKTNEKELVVGCKTSIIPSDGSVTSIDSRAFSGCTGLTSITIGNSVTSIGYCAFEDCTSLTSITIPDSVTSIGGSAFSGCTGLISLTVDSGNKVYHSQNNCIIETNEKVLVVGCKTSIIPSDGSVTSIGWGAFSGCTGLTSITIPDSVTSIVGSAFSGCTGLTSITIPDSVTSIGYYAFSDCADLTSISIPDSVTSIGESAFSGCTGLTSITISDSVTSIGQNAFSGTAYYNNSDNWENGVLYIGKHLIKVKKTVSGTYEIKYGTKTITELAFSGCTSLTSISIPDSVTSIGDYAFYNCTGLTSVTIPDSVTSIGFRAFSGCTGLTSVTIPDSVTSIGNYAFYKCTGLTSITIGNSVTSIGYYAFYDCTGLTSINWNAECVGYFNEFSNAGTAGEGIDVVFGDNVKSIPAYMFYSSSSDYKTPNIKSVTIGNSITSIGGWAFRGCTDHLIQLTVSSENKVYHSQNNCIIKTKEKELVVGCKTSIIPSDGSVTSIGGSAFEGCTGLTSITIPDSVTSIGDRAFEECTGLTSITIPDSVTNIGWYAFENCTGLTSITIPDSVTSIGDHAFRDCTGLTSITIPNSVTSIGPYAFGYYYNYDSEIAKKIDNFTIYGHTGTAAETYATENGFTFIALDDEHTHSFSEWTVTKEATCTEEGEEKRSCSCGETQTRKIEKIDHSFFHVEEASTCKVQGVSYDICDMCNETFNYTVLPFAPHTFGDWAVTKEATCTAEGEEERTCSVCGAIETRKAEKKEHTLYNVTEASTCKVKGVSYDVCVDCNETFNYTILPLAPHTFGDWTTTKEAKCESAGEESRSCSVCGVTETREIAALEHDYKHITTVSTCTKHGYEKDVCDKCGNEINYKELPLVPHTFGAWVVTKEATVFETGEKVRVCSVCSFSETEEIEKIKAEEVKDEKTNVSVICPDGSYEETVEIQVTETFDGESYHVLNTEKGNYKKSLFDITTLVDGKKVQPNGSVWVKIPLPESYNPEKTTVYHVTNDGKLEKIESHFEGGYIIFETTHFSYYAIVDEGSQINPSSNCTCACHKKGIVKFFFKIGLFFQKIFKKNKVCKCGAWHY